MEAAVDLSAKQYHIVRQSAANKVDVASLATDSAICGILDNKPVAGEGAAVRDAGLAKLVAGAAITQGVHLTVQSAGRAVAVASGGVAIGRALEAAGADGDIIAVRLYTPVRWSGAA
jgi:hypothetical protein